MHLQWWPRIRCKTQYFQLTVRQLHLRSSEIPVSPWHLVNNDLLPLFSLIYSPIRFYWVFEAAHKFSIFLSLKRSCTS